MRKRNIQYSTMLIGSLMAVAIVFAQLCPLHVSNVPDTEMHKGADEAADETVIALPSFSLPSPLHVTPGLNTHCLFEIFLQDDEEETSGTESPAGPQKLWMTLFRVIISPNAP